jgi:hypothetical protein
MHAAEPLVPETSFPGLKLLLKNLKIYKLPGIDQIPAEVLQSENNTFPSESHKLICGIRKIATRVYYLTYL